MLSGKTNCLDTSFKVLSSLDISKEAIDKVFSDIRPGIERTLPAGKLNFASVPERSESEKRESGWTWIRRVLPFVPLLIPPFVPFLR